MDFAAIPRPAFGTARQHLPSGPQAVLRKTTKADARYQRAALTAAELLPELPKPGESVHCLMTGTYDLCQVIIATAARLPSLVALRIATLCFSKRNRGELLSLLEVRTGLKLVVLVSHSFKGHNKEECEAFAADLAQYPDARLVAARSHAKVVTFDAGPDDGLVFEGSANLRNNRNREQLTAIRDRTLHDWHAAWIDDMVCRGEGDED